MIKFSEYVSIGHPDKIADYISQYLLDRYIEQDPDTRYAVEVQVKGYNVTLGGEVSSKAYFTDEQIANFVREAVNDIGYNREYMRKWGAENTICGDMLVVASHIGQQSPDIAKGLAGWGDQGIFFGYYSQDEGSYGLSTEHALAQGLCHALFNSGLGGLDIKTQVVMSAGNVIKTIAAIPLLHDSDTAKVEEFVRSFKSFRHSEIIVNGTGRYVRHSSIADCGTTGRKLAVDFYGGACRIGGGSPWTKDGSKADLTLNLYARELAKEAAKSCGGDVYVSLACCIGKKQVDFSISDASGNIISEGIEDTNPAELRKHYKLDTPIYASMCRWGLFGQFQTDKEWER